MDVNLGYAAWLAQKSTEIDTLELTFDDSSSVFFSLSDHTTCINVTSEPEIQEPNLD
ncbi:hypothetical protein [Rheinheimera maricola]|uniref:Uncharacterized protein n=1 Tax=Rheinheimera maricola TaxID=2793282 RepID=A0ABS7XBM6_9GAMM|nr:hypothetical protein [Rheinheimera maricola]MBZ9612964.1 hypothetical protein [Rheinheimera maricola]